VTKSNAQKGTVLRRLNRREYQNTINDLLGVKVNVIDSLPEDGRAQGFDNIGEALSISGIQMQRYMEAAELAHQRRARAGSAARGETGARHSRKRAQQGQHRQALAQAG
jgi:hypothetical protein